MIQTGDDGKGELTPRRIRMAAWRSVMCFSSFFFFLRFFPPFPKCVNNRDGECQTARTEIRRVPAELNV